MQKDITESGSMQHVPVLLDEMIEYLSPQNGKHYLDCTFGAGGYSKAILNKADCFVTAIDQDLTVANFANDIKNDFEHKFNFIHSNFADAKSALGNKKFAGIVLDLGMSSMQIDSSDRGFSFMKDGPLDMRMGNQGSSAFEFIAESSEEEIANVIYKYGEEVQSRQIAKAIINARKVTAITSTLELSEIIREAMHFRKSKIDPATKTFQAIRIHINKELESLEKLLNDLETLLEINGRVVVVSFHSLEDSIVKLFFKKYSSAKIARSKYATTPELFEKHEWLKTLTKKPIAPTRNEIIANPRSRSAKLRAAIKIRGVNNV